jgi:hypothetical protein
MGAGARCKNTTQSEAHHYRGGDPLGDNGNEMQSLVAANGPSPVPDENCQPLDSVENENGWDDRNKDCQNEAVAGANLVHCVTIVVKEPEVSEAPLQTDLAQVQIVVDGNRVGEPLESSSSL